MERHPLHQVDVITIEIHKTILSILFVSQNQHLVKSFQHSHFYHPCEWLVQAINTDLAYGP